MEQSLLPDRKRIASLPEDSRHNVRQWPRGAAALVPALAALAVLAFAPLVFGQAPPTYLLPGGGTTNTAQLPAGAVPPATLSLFPLTRTVAVDSSFQVEVRVSGASPLLGNGVGGFEFRLAYSPTVLMVEAAEPGEFTGRTGRTIIPANAVIDGRAGIVRFAAISLGTAPLGPTGSGTLALVRVRAIAAGPAALAITDGLITGPGGGGDVQAVSAAAGAGVQVWHAARLSGVKRRF